MVHQHPEVKYISLLDSFTIHYISLYAGNSKYIFIIGILSIGYTTLYKCFVKKPIHTRQSAGNQFCCYSTITDNNDIKLSSSETTRGNFNINQKNKTISDHPPTHSRPLDDSQFGHYLAGLIEGYGCFSPNKIVISFHESDASQAYFIKGFIGYGNVYKVKNKKALNYIVCNLKGRLRIVDLIYGKLRTNKIKSFNLNILTPLSQDNCIINTTSLLDNYWQAGFIDADGSFQIKKLNRTDRPLEEIRLNLQIDQKTDNILILIKKELGGSIGFRAKIDCYYYYSVNFSSTYKYINYLDNYNLQSSKSISFNKWRTVYRMILSKEHLTKNGVDKIRKIKLALNCHYHD